MQYYTVTNVRGHDRAGADIDRLINPCDCVRMRVKRTGAALESTKRVLRTRSRPTAQHIYVCCKCKNTHYLCAAPILNSPSLTRMCVTDVRPGFERRRGLVDGRAHALREDES